MKKKIISCIIISVFILSAVLYFNPYILVKIKGDYLFNKISENYKSAFKYKKRFREFLMSEGEDYIDDLIEKMRIKPRSQTEWERHVSGNTSSLLIKLKTTKYKNKILELMRNKLVTEDLYFRSKLISTISFYLNEQDEIILREKYLDNVEVFYSGHRHFEQKGLNMRLCDEMVINILYILDDFKIKYPNFMQLSKKHEHKFRLLKTYSERDKYINEFKKWWEENRFGIMMEITNKCSVKSKQN